MGIGPRDALTGDRRFPAAQDTFIKIRKQVLQTTVMGVILVKRKGVARGSCHWLRQTRLTTACQRPTLTIDTVLYMLTRPLPLSATHARKENIIIVHSTTPPESPAATTHADRGTEASSVSQHPVPTVGIGSKTQGRRG